MVLLAERTGKRILGLLVSEWKTNIIFIAAIVFLSTLFANISTIVSWIAD